MKHWADKVDWRYAASALVSLIGLFGYSQAKIATLESRAESSDAEHVRFQADMREMRAELTDCRRHG